MTPSLPSLVHSNLSIRRACRPHPCVRHCGLRTRRCRAVCKLWLLAARDNSRVRGMAATQRGHKAVFQVFSKRCAFVVSCCIECLVQFPAVLFCLFLDEASYVERFAFSTSGPIGRCIGNHLTYVYVCVLTPRQAFHPTLFTKNQVGIARLVPCKGRIHVPGAT